MFARVTTTKGQAKKDDVIRVIRERILPAAERFEGYKGGYWLLDEQGGKGIALTLWDSDEALRASAEPVGQLRTQTVNELGVEVESVESFEVIVTAGVAAEVSA